MRALAMIPFKRRRSEMIPSGAICKMKKWNKIQAETALETVVCALIFPKKLTIVNAISVSVAPLTIKEIGYPILLEMR